MSIICTTYVPDGIVLAADSRLSVNMNLINKDNSAKQITHIFPATDNMQKVFLLRKVQAGISVISAMPTIDNDTVSEFIRKFEEKTVKEGDSIFDIATKLFDATKQYTKLLTFHVAGYDGGEPFFYSVSSEGCKRLNVQNTAIQYGVTWSGEVATVQKLMMTEPKMVFDFKNFQLADAIDFTDFLMNTAISAQRFEMKPKTCGGPVDVLVLTKDGALWYRHKLFDNRYIEMPESQKSGCYISNKGGDTVN